MTETTPAVVDDETYDVTRSVLIRAHRSAVWEAITAPELITEWFGDTATFDRLDVGGKGVFGWAHYGDIPVEIVEIIEPAVFAFRWANHLTKDGDTLVRFTLDEVADGTLLRVVESGFDRLNCGDERRRGHAEDNREGWDAELDELVAFLEKQDSV
ncbi:MAG: SRPBCC domain-containing protein [Salinibacterium sp.]|nr:SRPBCC domain-containing protein [Salinibacterium sp.]